jgi:PLP dependent protein
MSLIADNLAAVRERIAVAARACGRDPARIGLVAVSKTKPAQAVQAAYAAGHTAFGENYIQEGCEKIESLAALRTQLEWHCIGPVQSNKTAQVAAQFDWVQSVDRLKIAQRLSAQRPAHLPPLNILVQVKVSGETNKSGVLPEQTLTLCEAISELPNLQLRGLMAIPEPFSGENISSLPRQFSEMASLYAQFRTRYPLGDTLSMGMSADMDLAIQHGATMLRVGTAIFGERQNKI